MIRVFKATNPIKINENIEETNFHGTYKLSEIGAEYIEGPWLAQVYKDGKQYFPFHTEWDEMDISDGDVVYFIPYVGLGFIATIVVAFIVSFALTFLIGPPKIQDIDEADDVNSFNGQRNQNRLGNPIEDPYGRCRLYPSVAATTYSQFIGNDQFQYQLFSLGHGSYEIDNLLIEDTPFSSFEEVEYQIVGPGEEVTLFPDNVEVSPLVQNTTLFGPNEEDFNGFVGGFVTNEARTLTNRIEMDLRFPQGLYSSNDEGGFDSRTISVEFEYRPIDDLGEPFNVEAGQITQTVIERFVPSQVGNIGWTQGEPKFGFWERVSISSEFGSHGKENGESEIRYNTTNILAATQRTTTTYYNSGEWVTLATFSRTMSTTTTQRFTVGQDVPPGRYEVRARRTNNASTSGRTQDTVEWISLRAFRRSVKEYGDITLLAFKARASNNLNDSSSSRINVWATRKLPIWENGSIPAFSDLDSRVATRNPIWAAINIMRSPYGGSLEDRFIGFEEMREHAEQAERDGINFDIIFNQRTTVWEAIKSCVYVNRMIPVLEGSQISFIRDENTQIPSFFISEDNIVNGTFSLQKHFFEYNPQDGLEVEYVDPITFKTSHVTCLLPGERGINLKKTTLSGVTDRQKAFELGMYLWSQESYEKTTVDCRLGLDGYIPRVNDIVRVQNSDYEWDYNAAILDIDSDFIYMDVDIDALIEGETYFIALRGSEGQDLGVFPVTATDETNKIAYDVPLPMDNIRLDGRELPLMTLGTRAPGMICRITDLRPSGQNEVNVNMILDDARRHIDYGDAPILSNVLTPPITPVAPVVDLVTITNANFDLFQAIISWTPALGASSYIVETSENGELWNEIDQVNGTSTQITVNTGLLYARVAGVGAQRGAFTEAIPVEVGIPNEIPELVEGFVEQMPFVESNLNLEWEESFGATSYDVSILTGNTVHNTFNTTRTTFLYSRFQWLTDQVLSRSFDVQVVANNDLGSTEPILLSVRNPEPAPVTNLSSLLNFENNGVNTFRLNWSPNTDLDFKSYKVYASNTQNFTPSENNLIGEPSNNSFEVNVNTGETLYWKVLSTDLWESSDDTLNFSIEQVIDA